MNHVPPLTSRTDRENEVILILKARIRARRDMDMEIAQMKALLAEMQARRMALAVAS